MSSIFLFRNATYHISKVSSEGHSVFSSSESSVCSDLLLQVDVRQRGHLAEPVRPEHLAEGAGGLLAGEAVDVQLLALVLSARQRAHGDGCGGGAGLGREKRRGFQKRGSCDVGQYFSRTAYI